MQLSKYSIEEICKEIAEDQPKYGEYCEDILDTVTRLEGEIAHLAAQLAGKMRRIHILDEYIEVLERNGSVGGTKCTGECVE